MDDEDPPEEPLIDAIEDGEPLEEIQEIVEADPWLLRCLWEGYLPLHYAMTVPCRPGVVRYLIEQYPESVRERVVSDNERDRLLPIEMAVHFVRQRRELRAAERDENEDDDDDEEEEEDDTVQVLVEAWPESLQERGYRGRLPMHRACDEITIRFLHQAYPEAISEPDEDGCIALHRAVVKGCPFSTLEVLTELAPLSVRAKDNRGGIPLHNINNSTGIEEVQHLVNLWEDSVHQLDDDNCAPLHYAASNPAVVRFLVGRGPGAVRIWSRQGNLPLHLAVGQGGTDVETIEALVGPWPESVREKTQDEEALLPVHIAAQAGALSDVRFLVERYPESVRERTAAGWLAVHLALQELNPDEALSADDVSSLLSTARFLLEQFPESAMEETTIEGYLPIHVFSKSGYGGRPNQQQQQVVGRMEFEFFQYLVQLAPKSVRMMSCEGLVPANYAISEGFHDLETTRFLVEQFPDAIKLRYADDKNVLHVSIERNKPRPEIVQYLAPLRPDLLRRYDDFGSTPLHVAVSLRRSLRSIVPGTPDPMLEIARFLVRSRPQSMREFDGYGNRVLHAAVASVEPDLDMVRVLVEEHPQSVGDINTTGKLPVHVILAHHGEIALPILTLLVESKPDTLLKRDISSSALPIHVALARRIPSLPMVTLLVENRPQALLVADDQGSLPLHVAVAHGKTCRLPIVTLLVKNGPQALLVADKRGSLPLHVAVAHGKACRLDLVQLLVEKRPESVRRKDSQGNLPLVVAASHDADLDVLFFLTTKWLESVHMAGQSSPSRPRWRYRKG